MEDSLLKRFPEQITAVTERIAGIEKDIAVYKVHKEKTVDLQPSITGGAVTVSAKFPVMTINGVEYTEKEPAAKALIESCKGVKDKEELPIGKYMGFATSLQICGFSSDSNMFKLYLRGAMTYQVELGTDTFGNITRINNALADLPKRLEGAKAQLETLQSQQESARQELEKPFTLAVELAEKETRLALLNAELNIDGNEDGNIENGDSGRDSSSGNMEENSDSVVPSDAAVVIYGRVPQTAPVRKAKPSILDGIRNFGGGKNQTVSSKEVSTEHDI